jgi:hypothetical protein
LVGGLMNWKGSARKHWWLNQGTITEFVWGPKKTTQNLNQDLKCPCRDSNRKPYQYESRILPPYKGVRSAWRDVRRFHNGGGGGWSLDEESRCLMRIQLEYVIFLRLDHLSASIRHVISPYITESTNSVGIIHRYMKTTVPHFHLNVWFLLTVLAPGAGSPIQ